MCYKAGASRVKTKEIVHLIAIIDLDAEIITQAFPQTHSP